MRSTARLLLAIALFHTGYIAYADDTDQTSTVSPISQIQATDPLLPSGVTDQKGLVGTVLSKMFRSSTDRKIATAFEWSMDSLFNGTGCSGANCGSRVPVYNSTTRKFDAGSIRDNGAEVGIGGSAVS